MFPNSPAGSGAPLTIAAGNYSTPVTVGTESIRTGTAVCSVGSYCAGGVQLPCPAGQFGTVPSLTTSVGDHPVPKRYQPLTTIAEISLYVVTRSRPRFPMFVTPSQSCSGSCTAGFFCPAGSTNSTAVPCGNATVYCPSGSARPTTVSSGATTSCARTRLTLELLL
jgi:hypothetical protein